MVPFFGQQGPPSGDRKGEPTVPAEARLYLFVALISAITLVLLLSAPKASALFVLAIVVNAISIGWSGLGALLIIKKHRVAERARLQRLDKICGRES